MKYKAVELKEEFSINRIISIHYFEYMSDFKFAGESHNFWELLCVDKGEVEVTADLEKITLHRGDIIFHKPNEFHNVAANGVIAPNLVVISFECGDPSMRFFEGKILKVGEGERRLLAQILVEAREVFPGPLDNPYQEELIRGGKTPFGGEQLIKLYLEQLLIHLYRENAFFHETQQKQPYAAQKSEALYGDVVAYLEHNIRQQLTVEQICKDNLIGNSQLKKLFREREHCGVIEYFNRKKIDMAKELIRSRNMNFTQIADYLGYASVHYFSRQFKKTTGMTPTEYTASIKQLSESPYRFRL